MRGYVSHELGLHDTKRPYTTQSVHHCSHQLRHGSPPSGCSPSGGWVGAGSGADRPDCLAAAHCGGELRRRRQQAVAKWLRSLPAGTTVVAPANACYLVNEGIELSHPKDLTIYGATFMDKTAAPGPRRLSKGAPVFTVIGGSGVTSRQCTSSVRIPAATIPPWPLAGESNSKGTAGATIRGVTIANTFGDGITLAPLRGGSDHSSGTIVAPASGGRHTRRHGQGCRPARHHVRVHHGRAVERRRS